MNDNPKALMLATRPSRERDSWYLLFASGYGIVPALAHGARAGGRRASALQPFHTARVELAKGRGHAFRVADASVEDVRPRLASHLESMEQAATGLSWLRALWPERVWEPQVWHCIVEMLDDLDRCPHDHDGALVREMVMCRTALQLLAHSGFAPELSHCVRCERPCPPLSAVTLDAARGGVVCSRCGGGRLFLSTQARLLAQRLQGDQAHDPRERPDGACVLSDVGTSSDGIGVPEASASTEPAISQLRSVLDEWILAYGHRAGGGRS